MLAVIRLILVPERGVLVVFLLAVRFVKSVLDLRRVIRRLVLDDLFLAAAPSCGRAARGAISRVSASPRCEAPATSRSRPGSALLGSRLTGTFNDLNSLRCARGR